MANPNDERRELTEEERQAYQQEKKREKRKKQRERKRQKDGSKNGKPGEKGKATKWKGSKAGMNGHVFELPDEPNSKPNQFNRTVQELMTFVKSEFDHGSDAAYILKNEELPTIECPKEPDENASKITIFKWEQNYKRFDERNAALQETRSKLYSLILGQCSPKMISKLNTMKGYKEICDEASECIALLGLIRSIFYDFTDQKNIYCAIDDAWRQYYLCEQKSNETSDDFKDRFEGMIKTLEFYKCKVGQDKVLVQHELQKLEQEETLADEDGDKQLTEEEQAALVQAQFNARNKSAAVSFLKRADPKRFAQLLIDLENDQLKGGDNFPNDLSEALGRLKHYKNAPMKRNASKKHSTPKQVSDEDDDSRQGEEETGGNKTRDEANFLQLPHVTKKCFLCGKVNDHYASQCPTRTDVETPAPSARVAPHTLLQYSEFDAEGFSFFQARHACFIQKQRTTSISDWWILLDSGSTISIFRNKHLLKNIRAIAPNAQPLRLNTNGGVLTANHIGDLPGFGVVWYCPHSLANILSLSQVKKVCRVRMDSSNETAFLVTKHDGKVVKFDEDDTGLHYLNTKNKNELEDYCFVLTVQGQKEKFTRRELLQAERAERVYRLIGRPPHKQFLKIISSNVLKNCPVSVEDAKRAHFIWGPDKAYIRGVKTRQKPLHVVDFHPVFLPDDVLDMHRNTTLCVDVFYVQQVPILHSISRNVKFRTVQALRDQYKPTLLSGLQKILALYDHAGFKVNTVHADGQFAPLENELKPIQLNCCAAKEHVPEVERSARTSKEAIRKLIHGLPFQYFPRILIEEIVKHSNSWLNAFPHPAGISTTMSPRSIMTGRETDFATECRVEFGTYCMVYDEPDKTNTPDGRSRECLALGPTGNRQGTWMFLDLHTWEKVSRNTWDKLPMPDHIINIIHSKAKNEGRKKIKNGDFVFEWSPGSIMFDDDELGDPASDNFEKFDDGSETPQSQQSNHQEPVPVYNNNTDEENSVLSDSDDEDESILSESDDERTVFSDDDNGSRDDRESKGSPSAETDTEPSGAPSNTPTDPPNKPPGTDTPPETSVSSVTANEPSSAPTSVPTSNVPSSRYNLRQRPKQQQYSFLQLGHNPTPDQQYYAIKDIIHHAFAQTPPLPQPSTIDNDPFTRGPTNTDLFLNKAVRVFGQNAITAIIQEAKQLSDTETITPVHASTLTRQQKLDALRALCFVKRKRSGRYKGRICSDGRKQRSYISKQFSSSPTISLEALILSLCIDALEMRDVATCDIAGAYLNSDIISSKGDSEFSTFSQVSLSSLLSSFSFILYNLSIR